MTNIQSLKELSELAEYMKKNFPNHDMSCIRLQGSEFAICFSDN